MTKIAPTRRPTRPTEVGPQASSMSDIVRAESVIVEGLVSECGSEK